MKSRVTRILFFLLSFGFIGLFIDTIQNPQGAYYWFGIMGYFLVLLPVVFMGLRHLNLSIWNMVLGLTPFTLFLLCIYLTFVSEDVEKRTRFQILK